MRLIKIIDLSVVLVFLPSAANSQDVAPPPYKSNQIIVQAKPSSATSALAQFHKTHKTTALRTFSTISGLQIISVPAGETVPALIAKYQASGLVEFAEPDYAAQVFSTTPNDPR